ncbi:MAG: hypothetical protein ACYSR5_12780, partial [Planctomycetota bacterium]
MNGDKTNQSYFPKNSFHLMKVTVSIKVAREKNFVLNMFCTSQLGFVEKLWICFEFVFGHYPGGGGFG